MQLVRIKWGKKRVKKGREGDTGWQEQGASLEIISMGERKRREAWMLFPFQFLAETPAIPLSWSRSTLHLLSSLSALISRSLVLGLSGGRRVNVCQ